MKTKMSKKTLALRDKNGVVLKEGDVLHGTLPGGFGPDNYIICANRKVDYTEHYLLSCQHGPVSPIHNYHLKDLVRIGNDKKLGHLFVCD